MNDVERLLAERECEQLIYEYARLIDFGNAGQVANLFVADGSWRGIDLVLDGQDAIREWFTQRQALGRRISRHVFTNITIALTSESQATGICYLINYRRDRRDLGESLPLRGDIPKYVGECHDEFMRTDQGWRFASRQVVVAFVRQFGMEQD